MTREIYQIDSAISPFELYNVYTPALNKAFKLSYFSSNLHRTVQKSQLYLPYI